MRKCYLVLKKGSEVPDVMCIDVLINKVKCPVLDTVTLYIFLAFINMK